MELIAVYTTVATRDDARRIARAVVEGKLAACVQIDEIESLYAWKGAVASETEYRILAKTTAARYAQVETVIRSLHPYELPAIHAVAIERVHAPYGQWIVNGSTGDASGETAGR
jgi:periplasmic divalent cation tolerance protein